MLIVMRYPDILTALCLLYIFCRPVDGQCSGSVDITVGETPQTVASANFPNNYPNNARECEWRLTTADNYTDILMVHNVKKLGPQDTVEFFPGCDTASPDKLVLDSYDAGVLSDSNFTSPICINFTVMAWSTQEGFQETFIAFPRTVAASVCNTNTKNAVTATTTPLYLYNPEFPAKYSPDQDCIWEITNGGTGKDIILTFEIMSLENMCVDYVNVTAGGDMNPTTYCLTDVFITPFSLRNSSFEVAFHSDNGDGYRGFVASYVLEPCKDVVTALMGQPHLSYLSSNDYPSHYQSTVKSGPYSCTWQIDSAPAEGLFLFLTVDKLTDGDTLFVYEGTSDKTGTLVFPGQGDNYTEPCYFCNKSTTFEAVSSSVYIEFNVSSSGNAGFKLGYFTQASSSACSANAESSPLTLMANDTLQYFSSPVFNSSNLGSDCYWNISDGDTGRGVILTVEFAYAGADCSDFLQITGHDSSVVTVCSGTFDSSPIVLKKSYFQVKYNSSQFTNGKGFSISYILDAPCKGTVTMLDAVLPITTVTSPGYPSAYPGVGRSGGYVCKWHIEAKTNTTGILIRLNIFGLVRGDTIALYEGCDSNGIQKYISNNNTGESGYSNTVSFQGSAYIELSVTSSTGGSGLQLRMTSQLASDNMAACSANGTEVVATEEVQYFTSTNFPELYTKAQCLWQISAGTSGKTVVLTVEFYDIEEDGGCQDYLTIEGSTTNAVQICGQAFSHPIRNFTDTNFNVSFTSPDNEGLRGFVFSVVLDKPCNTSTSTMLEANVNVQSFSSEGYPNNYTWNRQSGDYMCQWIIKASDMSAGILLYLDIGGLSSGTTLSIYSGCDNSGTKLYPAAGVDPTKATSSVQTAIATGNCTFIEFSVGSAGGQGFKIQYMSVPASDNTDACSASAGSPVTREANDTLLYLTSSNFPEAYPSSSQCYWNITDGGTDRGVILTVEFNHFVAACEDYIMISEGSGSESTKVCSDTFNTSPMVFKNSSFQLMFNSNALNNASGFVISYILDAPCKGTVTNLKADLPITTFTSPGYPSPYPGVGRSGGYVCKWHIEAKTNTTGILIRLNICGRVRGDTIALYEGCDSNGIQKYISNNNTGESEYSNTVSFQGSAYIELSVTSSTGGSGLQLRMTSQLASDNMAACSANGTEVVATEEVQYFTSTNFPELYTKAQCLWQISAGTSGKTVVLTVEFYDIEEDGGCQDYLTIEGSTTNAVQICGQAFSHPIRNFTDTNFNVSFTSPDNEGFHGFVFSVVLDKPCNTSTSTMLEANVNVQSFSSEGYPNNYTWNRQSGDYMCQWIIKASDMSAGILLYLDIGGLSSGTTLSIYSGCDNSGTKLYPAADVDPTKATSSVRTAIATGNCTFIEFSVGSAGGQGFKIQYLSVAASDNTDACSASAGSPATREANDTLLYLTSSNFPEPYPSSSQCYWNITDGGTDRGVILTVEFNHFVAACEDYIMISEGSGSESTKVCSDTFNTSPMVFKNSSFQLMFNSNALNNASGFVISYILDAPCKGTVTNLKADLPITTFTSPGYPSPYPGVGRSGGYVCKWHIEAKTNTTGILIRLNICGRVRGDTIALYEGCDSNGIQKYISNNNTGESGYSNTVSFQGSAYIELSVTSSTGGSGLRLRMTSQLASDNTAACSANGTEVVATEEVQYFTSTNFPELYTKGQCLWQISAGTSGKTVVLTVEFYDIEEDGGCQDYLTIEGSTTNAVQICGQAFSHPIRNFTDTNFNVSFTSPDNEGLRGFVFSVVLDKPCNTSTSTMLEANVNVQSFSSEGYPNNYTWNRQSGDYMCQWIIKASDMSAGILLYLDIGGLSSGTTLSIYSGCDNSGTKLYPAAGVDPTKATSSVQTAIATGNCTFIEFSVGSAGGQGFKIQYMSVPASDNTDACSASAGSPVTREANDTLLYLTSSNFPEAYPSSSQCYWNITDGGTDRGVILTVEFNHFVAACEDYIMISEGSGSESTKVCSDTFNTSPMVFKNSSFQLMFNSNALNNASGFVISYILDAPCKGTVTNLKADLPITTFTSPGYPSPYPGVGRSGGYVCKWHIEAKTNTTGILIRLNICGRVRGDTIALYEGCDSNGIQKYISNNNTGESGYSNTVSFQGSAYIELSVTSSTGGSGLRLRMTSQLASDNTAACSANGTEVVATEEVQYFTSTNFPELYTKGQCLWQISAGTSGKTVVLTVEFYDIEEDGGCQDYLTIEGSTTNAVQICGQAFSHPIRNFTDTNFNVSFTSPDNEGLRGFVFSVVLDKPCNTSTSTMLEANVNVQSFSSEGYPNNYTWNRQSGDYMCQWIIKASDMSAGILLYLDIGGLSSGTTLSIYSGCDNSGTKLYPAAGVDPTKATSSVQTAIATGNCTFIEFSVGSAGGQGFKIQYMSVPASDNTDACSASAGSPVTREANDTLLYLTSSNFPEAYPSSSQCYWNITDGGTDRGVILTVEFNHFVAACEDYIMISEGSGSESTKVCSDTFNTSPMVFKNSSFQLMFNSNALNNASGFVISYILDAPCKGTVTNLKADLPITTFTSLDIHRLIPGKHGVKFCMSKDVFEAVGRSGGYVCKWHIEAKTNTTGILIRLNIYGRVRGDTIALYEGCDSNGIQKYISNNNTGESEYSNTVSFQGSAYIELSVTSSTGGSGLQLRMTSQLASDNMAACSANGTEVVATEEVQYFTSTNFPELYTKAQCLWQISAGTSGKTVVLTVEFYDIEEDGGCQDYLTIEGSTTNAVQICGQAFSHPIRNFTDTNFNVSFTSPDNEGFHGFVFSVVQEKPCTPTTPKMLVADVNLQSISSVGYPNNYTWNRQSGNYRCQWHIEAKDGSAGILLDLHMGGLSVGTYLNIYDGCDNTGTKLYQTMNVTQVTGAERTQIATGNSTFIEFIVESVGGQGFRIDYLSVPASDNSQPCLGAPDFTLNATDHVQFITSTNFPKLYDGGLTCKWNIADGFSGRGVFLKLYIYHIECTNDKLDIKDADGTTTKCSNDLITSPENFTSGSFVLDFLSNANVQKHGFVLSYILGPPCNGSTVKLVGNELIQEFASPLHPGNYPSAIPIGPYVCNWLIESSDNVANLLLAIETSNLTAGDTLEIFQGNVSGTRLYPPMGANLSLATGASAFEVSPGKSAMVKFSVTSSANSGFLVKYVEQRPIETTPACSATNLQLTATSSPTYLTSPNFPDNYPNDQQCTWSIDDGGSYRGVILQLLIYQIQNATNCGNDELAIRKGPTKEEVKRCSDSLVTTTENYTDSSFEIYFKTDQTITKTGFQLRYIIDAPCNDSVIELNSVSALKQLISPEYPAYPGALYSGPYTCYFVITPQGGADGNLMSFNLSGIDAADSIIIYDGRNSSGTVIYPSARRKRSTGINNQVVVRNSGSSAFIQFTVRSPTGSTGFVVDYVSHPATNNTGSCNISAAQLVATSTIQYITSTNFPALYPKDQVCSWQISNGISGIDVLLTLITFQIQEKGSACDGDRINVKQGPSKSPNVRCSNSLVLSPEVFKSSSFDIEFTSDSITEANEHGFLLSYILYIPCQGGPTVLSADVNLRNFSSPEYPSNYPSTTFIGNYTCNWLIQANEPGAGILLIVNMEGLNAGDTLLIYSGTNANGTRRYPTTIDLQSNTNASVLHFAPGSSAFVSFTATTTANKGFHITYMAIKPSNTTVACANNAVLPLIPTTSVQYITTPNFPQLYTSGLSCRWTISRGNVNADVILTVIILHTEADVCGNDTLVIKGEGASAINLCSDQVSTTTREYRYRSYGIEFDTNNNDNNRGFVISYVLGPEEPIPPKYTRSEKIAIAIAASVGPAVLFLVLAVVTIALCFRRKMYHRKRRPRQRRNVYQNGGFMNGHLSGTNGHPRFDKQNLHEVKTEKRNVSDLGEDVPVTSIQPVHSL